MDLVQRFNKILIAIMILFIFSACGDSSNPSSDASLSGLTLSAGSVDPVFASGTTSYTLMTTNESTTVTPTASSDDATISVNGIAVVSGVASASIALQVGETTISILVTAEDGSTTETYTVMINRSIVVSTDASLSGLSLSAGNIEPLFASGTTDYSLTTDNESTTVTPAVNQAEATIAVNGAVVDSGEASAPIALGVGATTVTIVVTAEDGSTTETYNVTINRSVVVSTDATLSGLTLSAGDIEPVFSSGTTSYTLTATNDSTTVTPTLNQAEATVTVNATAVDSGSASESIPLAVGETAINIVVTAEDGSTTQTYSVTVTINSGISSLELIDPTPGTEDKFGSFVVSLANGNIAVSDPYDSTVAPNSGAVHLYSPTSSTPIASIYGDDEEDNLGGTGIFALANNNFVIVSSSDDEDDVSDAGSVRLMNGTTGVQIGTALTGDIVGDQLGRSGISALSNNNYLIKSDADDEGGIVDGGSVRLVNGSTGVQIGATLAGNMTGDFSGFEAVIITELGNNNYVIASPFEDEGGIVDAGTVRLIDSATGVQIGETIAGDVLNDQFGRNGVTALGNNNYVIAAHRDDEGGSTDVGTVRLVSGETGEQIGVTLTGDVEFDNLGYSGVISLDNNNYAIASAFDDEGGVVNAGSVRLMNGATGVQIGMLTGDLAEDKLGISGITALGNGNYVIASRRDDESGVIDAGSVRLVDGSTGQQIGSTLTGDTANDFIGSNGTYALGNNNYIVASTEEDADSIINAGSVRLMNGSTGEQIGDALTGDFTNDYLGRMIVTLDNNNFVIGSQFDTENGIVEAGSVRLVNGSTAVQIGPTLAGDVEFDRLALSRIITLNNSNYVVLSGADDEGGVENAGSARMMNGSTGVAFGAAIVGEVTGDSSLFSVTKPDSGDHYILSQPYADNVSLVDSGKVRIVQP